MCAPVFFISTFAGQIGPPQVQFLSFFFTSLYFFENFSSVSQIFIFQILSIHNSFFDARIIFAFSSHHHFSLMVYYMDHIVMVLERTFLFRVKVFCTLFCLCSSQLGTGGAFRVHVLERDIGILIFVDILLDDSHDWG